MCQYKTVVVLNENISRKLRDSYKQNIEWFLIPKAFSIKTILKSQNNSLKYLINIHNITTVASYLLST